MIKYSEKLLTRTFCSEKSKDAYMKVVKWLAINVLNKDELARNVSFTIEKLKDSDYPSFELTLYVSLDETEIRQENCKICKETHSSFFISEETNCNWCKTKAYQRRTDDMIKRKVTYYKNLLTGGYEE